MPLTRSEFCTLSAGSQIANDEQKRNDLSLSLFLELTKLIANFGFLINHMHIST